MVLNAEKGRPNVATGREVLDYSIPGPFSTEVMIHPESQRDRVAATRIIQILCVCVVCIVLVAGLWPFHAPKNNVSWIAGENGLHFERYGTAVTSNPFHPGGSNGESSCSLEIWLYPGLRVKVRSSRLEMLVIPEFRSLYCKLAMTSLLFVTSSMHKAMSQGLGSPSRVFSEAGPYL
jgi:hypothetical protein